MQALTVRLSSGRAALAIQIAAMKEIVERFEASNGRLARGQVKFFRSEKGWRGISSPDVPADVWVHFSVIDMPGYKSLDEGDEVEFRYVERQQDRPGRRSGSVLVRVLDEKMPNDTNRRPGHRREISRDHDCLSPGSVEAYPIEDLSAQRADWEVNAHIG